MTTENTCVLCIKAKHKTDTKHIQAAQSFFTVGMNILLQNGIVQFAHKLTGFDGDLFLSVQKLTLFFYKKLQAIILLAEILKHYTFRLTCRLLHIVDKELFKIASDDPTRTLRIRQCRRISLCLLKRIEQSTIRLTNRTTQIKSLLFLFDQHMRRGNMTVNKAGMVQLYAFFKQYKLFGLRNAQHVTCKRKPKGLAVALFVTTIFPIFRKGFCGSFSIYICHNFISKTYN